MHEALFALPPWMERRLADLEARVRARYAPRARARSRLARARTQADDGRAIAPVMEGGDCVTDDDDDDGSSRTREATADDGEDALGDERPPNARSLRGLLLSSRESAEAKGEERSRRLSRLEQPDPQPPPPEDRRTSMVTSDDPIFLTAEDAKARATVRAKRLEERAAKEERVRVMWKHFVARRAIRPRNSAQFSDRRLHRLLSGHECPRRQRGDCQAPRDRASQSSCAQA